MKFPIDQVRASISGCQDKLFFNSAGSSLMSDRAVQIFKDYADKEADIGGYDVMANEAHEFTAFYIETAKLINAEPRNIAFAVSATDAYSKILYSIDWKKDDVVLITNVDYVSNVLGLVNIQKRFGIKIEFIETISTGEIDLNDLESKLINLKPRLLALTQVPTNSGMIQLAEEAGSLCQKYDCLYLLDACQSVGQIKVDVKELQCDFMAVTGRKFLRGPRGTGFLFVVDKFINSDFAPLCVDLNGTIWTDKLDLEYTLDAKRFAMWERNYSCLLGLTQSIREINDLGIENIEVYNQELNDYYRKALSRIPGLQFYDQGLKTCNILTFRINGLSKEETIRKIKACGVLFSVAHNWSAKIDMAEKGIEWVIRFSPHYFNTKEEIDLFVERYLNE